VKLWTRAECPVIWLMGYKHWRWGEVAHLPRPCEVFFTSIEGEVAHLPRPCEVFFTSQNSTSYWSV